MVPPWRWGVIAATTFALTATCAAAWQWDLVGTTGQIPPPRYGHALLMWEAEPGASAPQAIACGGAFVGNGSLISDCYILQSADWSWTRLTRGYYVRSNFAAVIHGDFLLLFGGNTTDPDPTNPEILKVGSWQHVTDESFAGLVPVARQAHTGVVHAATNAWVIYGGLSTEDGVVLGDLAALGLGDGIVPAYVWSRLNVSAGSPQPPARHCHAAVMNGDTMIVVGGISATGIVLRDVWALVYTPAAGAWAWEEHTEASAIPRYGHSLIIVSANYLILYGGADALPPSSASPTAAYSPASGVLVCDGVGSHWGWRSPAVGGDWLHTPVWGAVSLVGTDDATLSQQLVAFGGLPDATAGPVDPSTYTGKVGVLTGIGQEGPSKATELAALLGAGAGALFLVAVMGFVGWRCRAARARAAEHRRAELSALLQRGGGGWMGRQGGGTGGEPLLAADAGWSLGLPLGPRQLPPGTPLGSSSSGGSTSATMSPIFSAASASTSSKRLLPAQAASVYGAAALPNRGGGHLARMSSGGGSSPSYGSSGVGGRPTLAAPTPLLFSNGAIARPAAAAAVASTGGGEAGTGSATPRGGGGGGTPSAATARVMGRSGQPVVVSAASSQSGRRRQSPNDDAHSVGSLGTAGDGDSSGAESDREGEMLKY